MSFINDFDLCSILLRNLINNHQKEIINHLKKGAYPKKLDDCVLHELKFTAQTKRNRTIHEAKVDR